MAYYSLTALGRRVYKETAQGSATERGEVRLES